MTVENKLHDNIKLDATLMANICVTAIFCDIQFTRYVLRVENFVVEITIDFTLVDSHFIYYDLLKSNLFPFRTSLSLFQFLDPFVPKAEAYRPTLRAEVEFLARRRIVTR